MQNSDAHLVAGSTEDFPTSEVGKSPSSSVANSLASRVYLFVPFDDKDEAYKLGARWDKEKTMWFLPPGVDSAPFGRWAEEPRPLSRQDMEDQLWKFCEDYGLVLVDRPIIDGNWHSTTVSTTKSTKSLKGAYKASFVNEGANGFIVNHDTGDKIPWFAKGVVSDVDRERNREIAAENNREREQQLQASYEAVSKKATSKWASLPLATDHPYLQRKQVEASGLRLDGNKLVTAICDPDGKIWSLQYIDPRGGKLYEKGGAKTGHFHVLGDLEVGKSVIFGEGYATCASLHSASRLPTIEVFDGGNLDHVMAVLRPRLPGRNFIICGDDDVLTRDRIVRTLNKVATSDFAKEKLLLSAIDDDEIVIDGTTRRLRGNPDCSMRLEYQLSPEGVQRIVGSLRNEATDKQVPVKIVNGGREKALAAAAKHGAQAVFPVFKSLEGAPTDFNDLAVREGEAVVRRQVGLAMVSRATVLPGEKTPADLARSVIGDGTVLSQAKDNRRYVGPVVGNTMAQAVQDTGRKTAVAHNLEKLNKVPEVGPSSRIVYNNGRGHVEPSSKARETGIAR